MKGASALWIEWNHQRIWKTEKKIATTTTNEKWHTQNPEPKKEPFRIGAEKSNWSGKKKISKNAKSTI